MSVRLGPIHKPHSQVKVVEVEKPCAVCAARKREALLNLPVIPDVPVEEALKPTRWEKFKSYFKLT